MAQSAVTSRRVPSPRQPVHRVRGEPVPVVAAAGQVPGRVGAEAAQHAHEHGRRAHAVDVVVAVDDHARARARVAQDERDRGVDAGEGGRIVGLLGRQPRPRARGLPQPAAHEHLRQRVRQAQFALQPCGGGEGIGGDLEARLGHAATVRPRPDGIASRSMRFVDLSTKITQSPPETPEFLRTEIDYTDHAGGAATIEDALRHRHRPAARRRGLGGRGVRRFGTHNSTHVDAPWHYNSHDSGQAGPDHRRAAAGVVLRPRRRPRLQRARRRRDGDGRDAEAELLRIGHDLRPLDIVLVRTGRDAFYAAPDYMIRGPGRDRRGHPWLFDRGVRVMGIDAWGWDVPLNMRPRRPSARREGHLLGRPPGRPPLLPDRAAGQPRPLPPDGFRVACFPLKLERASAAPARVVAILDD